MYGLKGGNHREIHKDLKELYIKGVCGRIPLGSGYYVLTKMEEGEYLNREPEIQ
jgi:hypothetical protein